MLNPRPSSQPSDTAILLLNLGGPLHLRDIRPFLLNLFNDRDIIKLGPVLLQPLIARIIVGSRLEEVTHRYTEIGGGSPILQESAAQAAMLRRSLRGLGRTEPVKLVFRYTAPRAAGVLRSLANQGIRRLLPVTLYPHDCRATTGSSVMELEREAVRWNMEVLPGVRHYATMDGYLRSLEEGILVRLVEAPEATVVFSAHSLPLKQIQTGDPYEREIHATVEALKARLGDLPGGYRLGYQSKVGPVEWLKPPLEDVLKSLPGRDVIIVPISFVGEHIETLHELDIEYHRLAEDLGVKRYLRVPAPGLHPAFLKGLLSLTHDALKACD